SAPALIRLPTPVAPSAPANTPTPAAPAVVRVRNFRRDNWAFMFTSRWCHHLRSPRHNSLALRYTKRFARRIPRWLALRLEGMPPPLAPAAAVREQRMHRFHRTAHRYTAAFNADEQSLLLKNSCPGCHGQIPPDSYTIVCLTTHVEASHLTWPGLCCPH